MGLKLVSSLSNKSVCCYNIKDYSKYINILQNKWIPGFGMVDLFDMKYLTDYFNRSWKFTEFSNCPSYSTY